MRSTGLHKFLHVDLMDGGDKSDIKSHATVQILFCDRSRVNQRK